MMILNRIMVRFLRLSILILTFLLISSLSVYYGFNNIAMASGVWTSQTSNANTGQLQSVAFGGGKWLAVDPVSSEIVSSTDGITWVKQVVSFLPNDAVYTGTQWVVVGSNSTNIMTSPNGNDGTWTNQTSGVTSDLYSVAYNGSLIVAVGQSAKVLTSTNGVSWSSSTQGTQHFNRVTYGGGKFIAVGMGGTIYTSPDGAAWTQQTSGTSNDLWGVTYGNNLFIAVGSSGTLLTSPDGATWTPRSVPNGSTGINGTAYGVSKFVAAGDNGKIISSLDGVNWSNETLTSNTTNYFNAVAYGQSKFVAVGQAGWLETQLVSTNANLSDMTLDQGTLSPAFAAGTTSYAASVGNAVSSIQVTPTVADSTATLKVNGSDVTSGSAANVPLNIGANTITVLVTAQDGTSQKTYTVTVTRAAPSSNADLSSLILDQGTLSPSFASGTISYTDDVAYTVSSLNVTPTIADSTATLKVNGSDATSGSAVNVPLNIGANTITVLVTAQDGTSQKTYTVTVTRAAAVTNADLSSLILDQGSLSPSFASGTISYTNSVAYTVSSLNVTPTRADSTATLQVNGNAAASGSAANVPLNVGANTVTVLVTAQDNSTKTYTVTITRAAASASADLSNLILDQGTLSPTFAAGTTSYTANVGNAVSSLNVTPTRADSTATLHVNGIAAASGSAVNVPLSVGANTITVLVTAQDNSTKTYTVTITRAVSNNADLSGLTLSAGTLNPAFSSGTTSYTTSVGNSVYSIQVSAVPVESQATLEILANGTTVTGAVYLNNIGSNTVSVKVTAPDNLSSKTYTIDVNRQGLGTADISSITFMNKSLQRTPNGYHLDVGYENKSVALNVVLSDPNASFNVIGAAYTANSILKSDLAIGTNSLTIVVTTPVGQQKSFEVTIDRSALPTLGYVDLNQDGKVNIDDAIQFATHVFDINLDGKIDIDDMRFMLSQIQPIIIK
jgi:hypothetical protein